MDAQHPDGLAVIECKHVGGFETLETIVARYMPQIHWQMYVTGAEIAVLSIIEGARAPVVEEVRLHSDYVSELLQRADDFWRCVTTLTPPVMPPPVEPPRPAAVREVDMSTSNEWGSFAPDWIEPPRCREGVPRRRKEAQGAWCPTTRRAPTDMGSRSRGRATPRSG